MSPTSQPLPSLCSAAFFALLALACEPPAEDSADTGATIDPWIQLGFEPEEPSTSDLLRVVVEADDSVQGYTFAWYRDNQQESDLEGAMVPAEYTARDQTWRVVVTPDRPGGPDQPVSAKIVILNTPPELLSLALSEDPDVTSDISASASTEDADGDSVTVEYEWSLDGEPLEGAWGGSLPGGLFQRDQAVSVQAVPHDGTDPGEGLSAEVTVGNAPPSVAAASLGVSTAAVGATLELTVSGWYDPDGDEEGYLFDWYADDEEVGSGTLSFTLDSVEAGAVVYCRVIPFDGFDEGEPVLSELVLVVEESS